MISQDKKNISDKQKGKNDWEEQQVRKKTNIKQSDPEKKFKRQYCNASSLFPFYKSIEKWIIVANHFLTFFL